MQLKSKERLVHSPLRGPPALQRHFLMANFSTSSFNTHRKLDLKYLLVDFFWEFMLCLLGNNDQAHTLTPRQMEKYILHKSPTGHC